MDIETLEQLQAQVQSQPTLLAKARFLLGSLHGLIAKFPQPFLSITDSLLAQAWITRDREAIPPLLRCKGLLHTALSQFTEGFEAYGDLLRHAREADNSEQQAIALQGLGIIHRLRGDIVRAIDSYQQAATLCQTPELSEAIAPIMNSLAICYSIIGEYGKALQAYHSSLEAYRLRGNHRGIAKATLNIGSMYLNIGDHASAAKHFQEYLELQPKFTDPPSTGVALQGMARLHLEQGNHSEATRFATEAAQFFTRLGNTMGKAKAIGTLGLIHRATGKLSESLPQFQEAAELAQSIGETETYVISLQNVGTTLMELGEITQARIQLEQAEQAARRHILRDHHLAICGHLADVCGLQEDFPNAYRFRTEQLRLDHEIADTQKQKALAELQTRYDLSRAEREREIYRLKSEQLQMVVEYKTSELSSIALSLIHKQELLESIAGRLRHIQKLPPEDFELQFAELLQELLSEASTGSGWTLFKENLRQSDQSFLRRLAERYPKLTPTELQVCALLKMELATKDIASILGVSERDVESHRYNLRKKLTLTPNESLVIFLNREEFRAAESDRANASDQEFTERLLVQFPELSAKELKICALLKAGLSTKEITQLLSISDRTVENHRYHIRKKLNLPPNSNLSTFFATL